MAKSYEITIDELKALPTDSYVLIDIRETKDAEKSPIPNAVNIPRLKVSAGELLAYKEKKIVFSCYMGISSKKVTEKMLDEGYDAYSLKGGYSSVSKHK